MASSLLTVFCGDYEVLKDEASTKRSDLQERSTRDMRRPVLTRPGERIRKYAIETGCHRKSKTPAEPWLCTDPSGAMRLYAQIMEVPDGGYRLADADSPHQLEQLAYMADEQLITIGPGGSVHVLGDRKGAGQARYPGAPEPDKDRGGGGHKSLGMKARDLVLSAWANITRRGRLAFVRQSSQLRDGGIAVSTREICAEANRIKAKYRRDLDEYRYLSTETCRRIISGYTDSKGRRHKGLLEDHQLSELVPPRCIRAGRTWMTLPRVYELPPGAAGWPAAAAPARRKRKRKQKHRHSLRRAA
jgi:hypothetical protein